MINRRNLMYTIILFSLPFIWYFQKIIFIIPTKNKKFYIFIKYLKKINCRYLKNILLKYFSIVIRYSFRLKLQYFFRLARWTIFHSTILLFLSLFTFVIKDFDLYRFKQSIKIVFLWEIVFYFLFHLLF